MSRPLRISFPGAIYHVTSRGNARAAIFIDDDDRQAFLSLLAFCIGRFNWVCHAYCLMDNHFHLLIETPDANLQEGMRQLNGSYTQKFNRRHGRVGHVFQGRYKGILVERDSYLLELCRYLVLNPVRAKMVGDAGQYTWSSYHATAGLTARPDWLETDWLLSQFGKRKSTAQSKYSQFVTEGIQQESPWNKLKAQVLLGEESFVDLLRPFLNDHDKHKEVPGYSDPS
jgi:putative transposase